MRATAKKLSNNIAISYIITGDKKFLIMTNNETAVGMFRSVGINLNFENHSYHILVDELPLINGIEYKQYKIKPISDSDRKEIEVELQRLKDIEEAIQKMNETYEAQVSMLEKFVAKKGLKLKPHCPNDSQMFSEKHKERVHFKTSLRKIVDQEAIDALIEKHPQLKKCFKRKISKVFDRQEFDKLSKTLPAESINKIVSYEESKSLNFYELPDYECTQCGGKFTKKGVCKNCGQSK